MTRRVRLRRQRGFTLIEMIIVLLIVAALSVVAYAYFMPLYARVRIAFERDDLQRQLLELPQRVRQSGRGGILANGSAENLADGTIVAVEAAPRVDGGIENWQVLRLSLPVGWRLWVPAPIFYHFSGACEGGEVSFLLAQTMLRYRLVPPLCRPIEDDGSARG